MRYKLGLALSIAMASVAVPGRAEWVEASSDHFTVFGDSNEAEVKAFAERLMRFDKMLRIATKTPDTEAERANRVTVYMVSNIGAVQRLAGSDDIGGFYRPDAQGAIAVTPRTLNFGGYISPQEILFHEYTHSMLLSSTTTRYPLWVQEGYAEFFSTTQAKPDGSLVVGAPPKLRGFALADQYQISPEELLTADQRKLSPEESDHLYARGWLLLHMLFMKKERAGQLDKYLSLMTGGMLSLDAGRAAFGDFGKLNSDLRAYVRSSKFQGLEVPAAKLPVGSVRMRTLNACEDRMMPIRIRSAVGVNGKTAPQVAALARMAAVGCDRDAFVQRALTETEFDAKDNAAAMAAADRALSTDPTNVMAMAYKGRVHARNKDWVNARKWYIRANRQEPNFALPLVLFYDSYTRAGVIPPTTAVDGLLRAIVLVPQDPFLRTRVVRALLVQGDRALARQALIPLAYAAHIKPDSTGRKLLEQLDAGKATKELLAMVDKEKWNEVGNE